MGTNKIKCPKCKKQGTLRLRERNSNALIMSHYDPHLYKTSKKKGTRSCYIGSIRKGTRELFLKYTEFDSNSKEYAEFIIQLRKIKEAIANKTEPPFKNTQETTIAILHNLIKLRTIEKQKADEITKGSTWENIKCRNCDAAHSIKVYAKKRRLVRKYGDLEKDPYYQWWISHWIVKSKTKIQ